MSRAPSPVLVRRARVAAQLGLVAATLAVCTACLEHFESLHTTVVYDPYAQAFRVERRLVGIDQRFLGCTEAPECIDAIQRTLSGTPDPLRAAALSDRLLDRLLESGATDVTVTLERVHDRLDAVVTYGAPVGSAAADDTLVRAEWDSGGWPFGHYYLVVTAQDSMDPPGRHRTRKVARAGAAGVDWIEEWIMPRARRAVETVMEVADVQPLFEQVPELGAELEQRGWLDEPRLVSSGEGDGLVASADGGMDAGVEAMDLGDPEASPRAPSPSPKGSDRRSRAEASDGGPEDGPTTAALETRTKARGGGDVSSVALDPSSPAKTWVYEARISGGGVTPAAAAMSMEPLVPALSRCYQRRQRDVPELEGSLFLSALVRGDGSVVATSVSGGVTDGPLLACIDRVLGGWVFPQWGTGDAVSDVAIPVVFRVEKGPPRK